MAVTNEKMSLTYVLDEEKFRQIEETCRAENLFGFNDETRTDNEHRQTAQRLLDKLFSSRVNGEKNGYLDEAEGARRFKEILNAC